MIRFITIGVAGEGGGMEIKMSKSTKIAIKVLLGIFALFTGTFIVYIFNLDMKLTALIEPFLLKHYDKIDRDTHL